MTWFVRVFCNTVIRKRKGLEKWWGGLSLKAINVTFCCFNPFLENVLVMQKRHIYYKIDTSRTYLSDVNQYQFIYKMRKKSTIEASYHCQWNINLFSNLSHFDFICFWKIFSRLLKDFFVSFSFSVKKLSEVLGPLYCGGNLLEMETLF